MFLTKTKMLSIKIQIQPCFNPNHNHNHNHNPSKIQMFIICFLKINTKIKWDFRINKITNNVIKINFNKRLKIRIKFKTKKNKLM